MVRKMKQRYKKAPSPDKALTVACSRCGAKPGSPCMGARVVPQERKTPHAERFTRYANQVRAAL